MVTAAGWLPLHSQGGGNDSIPLRTIPETEAPLALFRKDRDRSDHPSPGERDFVSSESDVRDAEARPEPHAYTQGGTRVTGEKNFDAATVTAFLGQGTRLAGKITFEGPARIEGQVEGEIVASETLWIGEAAVVNAQVGGSTVIIHGKVTGDITASKRLEIRAPGKLYGNVTTPSLVIEEGVIFEGHCSMGASDNRGAKVTVLAKEDKPLPGTGNAPALKAQGESK